MLYGTNQSPGLKSDFMLAAIGATDHLNIPDLISKSIQQEVQKSI